jgi:hypothetical protein
MWPSDATRLFGARFPAIMTARAGARNLLLAAGDILKYDFRNTEY